MPCRDSRPFGKLTAGSRLSARRSPALPAARPAQISGQLGFWVAQRFSAAIKVAAIIGGFTACGKTHDSYQGMPSGIPPLPRYQIAPLGAAGLNSSFPQPV